VWIIRVLWKFLWVGGIGGTEEMDLTSIYESYLLT
jgi:hypothetical protein